MPWQLWGVVVFKDNQPPVIPSVAQPPLNCFHRFIEVAALGNGR
jgi:hypothetical protein